MDICLDLKAQGRCETVAVCDVYGPRVRAAAQKTGGKIYRNYKELLADPRVDVVCIATPDRLHAPQAIDAVRAGKDVYCEKPLTHWSQMDLARAARRRGREAQADRPGGHAIRGRRRLRQGPQADQGGHASARSSTCRRAISAAATGASGCPFPTPTPSPAPISIGSSSSATRRSADSACRGSSSGGCGGTTRAGRRPTCWSTSSRRSSACWTSISPNACLGGGGTFQYDREVPDQCNIIADYAGGPSVVLMNSLSNYTGIDTMLRGTDGVVTFGDIEHPGAGIRVVPVDKSKKEITVPWNGAGDTARLWANFLDCVKTRKRPFSPIDIAVRVQAPLNMGILSHRDGKVARFDKTTQKIVMT